MPLQKLKKWELIWAERKFINPYAKSYKEKSLMDIQNKSSYLPMEVYLILKESLTWLEEKSSIADVILLVLETVVLKPW